MEHEVVAKQCEKCKQYWGPNRRTMCPSCGGELLAVKQTSLLLDSDVPRSDSKDDACAGQLALLAFSVEQTGQGLPGLPHTMVCGSAVEGDCSSPCAFGLWCKAYLESLRRLLSRSGVELELAIVEGTQRIVVPPSRHRKDFPI